MAQELEEEKINPSDIIFEEGTDADMPEPETADYNKKEEPAKAADTKDIRLTPKCLKLFEECLGKLPYNTVLKNSEGNAIKLTELLKYVDAKCAKISVGEMNTILGFVATAPLEYVKPIMEIVENSSRQGELWMIL